jgi:hypothetical protein
MTDTFSIPCADAVVAMVKPNANAAMERQLENTVTRLLEMTKTLPAAKETSMAADSVAKSLPSLRGIGENQTKEPAAANVRLWPVAGMARTAPPARSGLH